MAAASPAMQPGADYRCCLPSRAIWRAAPQYEFGLVRSSLKKREVLLGVAPHIVRPMRFVLPHHRGLRPALLIRLSLFLYDHLGGGRRILGPSRSLDLSRSAAGVPLKPMFTRGFEYDARLVVLNAMDAASRGAAIRVRTQVLTARRTGGRVRCPSPGSIDILAPSPFHAAQKAHGAEQSANGRRSRQRNRPMTPEIGASLAHDCLGRGATLYWLARKMTTTQVRSSTLKIQFVRYAAELKENRNASP